VFVPLVAVDQAGRVDFFDQLAVVSVSVLFALAVGVGFFGQALLVVVLLVAFLAFGVDVFD
jgi:hypothetical protein